MFKEDFITVAPQNVLLHKLIPYYYFYQTFDPQFFKHFHYYPHYRLGLTIQKNSIVTWNEEVRVTKPMEGETSIVLTKNLKKRRLAKDHGIINKICIAFEPLGINHFINTPLSLLSSESLSYFDYFGEEFEYICEEVFNTSDVNNKVALLDDFFVSKLNGFCEFRIAEAVELILENDQNLSLQEIADRMAVNRKTINRLFHKHLGCSPQSFRQSVKFRKALNQYQDRETNQNLTHLAYDNHYYDQSELILHFKKLTGQAPKSLFSSIKRVGAFDVFWAIQP